MAGPIFIARGPRGAIGEDEESLNCLLDSPKRKGNETRRNNLGAPPKVATLRRVEIFKWMQQSKQPINQRKNNLSNVITDGVRRRCLKVMHERRSIFSEYHQQEEASISFAEIAESRNNNTSINNAITKWLMVYWERIIKMVGRFPLKWLYVVLTGGRRIGPERVSVIFFAAWVID